MMIEKLGAKNLKSSGRMMIEKVMIELGAKSPKNSWGVGGGGGSPGQMLWRVAKSISHPEMKPLKPLFCPYFPAQSIPWLVARSISHRLKWEALPFLPETFEKRKSFRWVLRRVRHGKETQDPKSVVSELFDVEYVRINEPQHVQVGERRGRC